MKNINFDLNDECYFLECFKNSIKIKIDNHIKSFYVSVKESKTSYSFNIRYAN